MKPSLVSATMARLLVCATSAVQVNLWRRPLLLSFLASALANAYLPQVLGSPMPEIYRELLFRLERGTFRDGWAVWVFRSAFKCDGSLTSSTFHFAAPCSYDRRSCTFRCCGRAALVIIRVKSNVDVEQRSEWTMTA